MSYGPTMAVGRRGSWRVEVEEDGGSRAPGVAVAFVPPPRGARESLSSCEDGSLGVYSDEDEEDLPYPGFLALTWGCLFQNTVPRNYCLAMLTNPYPFLRQRFRDLFSPCPPLQWRSVVRTKTLTTFIAFAKHPLWYARHCHRHHRARSRSALLSAVMPPAERSSVESKR